MALNTFQYEHKKSCKICMIVLGKGSRNGQTCHLVQSVFGFDHALKGKLEVCCEMEFLLDLTFEDDVPGLSPRAKFCKEISVC